MEKGERIWTHHAVQHNMSCGDSFDSEYNLDTQSHIDYSRQGQRRGRNFKLYHALQCTVDVSGGRCVGLQFESV